ncbi:MAG TPA: hypothetical protein VGT98_11105, partial [Candidatus Elarobacter sp.]|nr:hypothetical protein [Candidatus Elarobacter sp.]
LIRWHIESIDHMEMLLLLHRSVPRAWTIEEIARELHLPTRATVQCMEALVRGQLAAAESCAGAAVSARAAPAYRFAPGADSLSRAVDALAVEYEERPVALVTAVRSRPSVVLQSFADAFRVRRKP